MTTLIFILNIILCGCIQSNNNGLNTDNDEEEYQYPYYHLLVKDGKYPNALTVPEVYKNRFDYEGKIVVIRARLLECNSIVDKKTYKPSLLPRYVIHFDYSESEYEYEGELPLDNICDQKLNKWEYYFTGLIFLGDTYDQYPKMKLYNAERIEGTGGLAKIYIFADPPRGEAPLKVDFTVIALDTDRDIISYLWDFDDGSSSIIKNPTHTYSTEGEYNITCEVKNDNDEIWNDSIVIIVYSPKEDSYDDQKLKLWVNKTEYFFYYLTLNLSDAFHHEQYNEAKSIAEQGITSIKNYRAELDSFNISSDFNLALFMCKAFLASLNNSYNYAIKYCNTKDENDYLSYGDHYLSAIRDMKNIKKLI